MQKINLNTLKSMFKTGVENIIKQVEYINDLNVFPVPDGDTGVNLKLTLSKAIDNVYGLKLNTIGEFCQKFSRETLMNARGNSGVIMSQIIKGLTLPLSECQNEVSLSEFIAAFDKSYELSYKAVQNPTEGTMLSVTRFIHEAIKKNINQITNFKQLLLIIYEAGSNAVIQSPNLLLVLKENNAIDSGAYALMCFYRGFLEVNKIPIPEYDFFSQIQKNTKKQNIKQLKTNFEEKNSFGYCCEFIVELGKQIAPNQPVKKKYNYDAILEELNKNQAESVVIVQEDEILKIHAHLIKPFTLLKLGQKYGEFKTVKIENMNLQFQKQIDEAIHMYESDEFNIDKNSVVFCYLPTTEIKTFVYQRFKLDYFWDLESQGEPTAKNLVEEIYATKAKKVYGLITNATQRKKFLNAAKLINKKQSLYLLNVRSTVGLLGLLSVYEKKHPNWWNKKILTRFSKYISHVYLVQKENKNAELVYQIQDNKKIINSFVSLEDAAISLIEYYCENYKTKIKLDLVLIYNDLVIDLFVNKLIQTLHKINPKQDLYAFYVPSEKNVLDIGVIKCQHQN